MAMGPSGDGETDRAVAVEVRAETGVPAEATARAVELVRKLATASGRSVRYASVALSVDDQWPGRRRNQVEATIDSVGLYFRGFAAAATFAEALIELDETLRHRLENARDRLRPARQRPGR
jgi:hypothetical protein